MPADDGTIRNEMSHDERLEALGYWARIILNSDGSINLDQVLAELHDYKHMLEQVPSVYSAVTGGMLSKPGYFANDVLSVHEEYMEELIEEMRHEAVKDALDMAEAGHTRDEILKEFPAHDYDRRD